MSQLLIFLYKIVIQLYGWGLNLAALFHPKAALWVKGRDDLLEHLAEAFKKKEGPTIWFHCASLGEFEQGRPIIEVLKKEYPHYQILLTFYSPSGYEVRKNYPNADHITYLPLDTPKNAKRFIEIAQPKMAFFIKYEFWYFYLSILQERAIPYYLIAGVFRKDQLFFKPYGQWYLEAIQGFEHLFVQDQTSVDIAKKNGLKNVTLSGDPRVDRVAEIANNLTPISKIDIFKNNKKLMILGSTHKRDEALFFECLEQIKQENYFNDWKFLLVPHEIDEGHLGRIEALSPITIVRYSTFKEQTPLECSMLVLDTIGQLSAAYQYGDMVYIGGGFDEGIHNVLEPAVFGLPIVFGPKYHKFKEAKDLIKVGGAFEISDANDLLNCFNKLQDKVERKARGVRNSQYIKSNIGCTERIINYLKNKNILKE